MASREKIDKAKRHFENPVLIEHIQSGGLSVSYEYALILVDALTAAEDKRARLREAIEKHRRNRWGDGTVKNDEDWWLYAALQEAGDEV